MKTFAPHALALALAAALPAVALAQNGGMQPGGMQQSNGMQQSGGMSGDDKSMGMALDKHFAMKAGNTNHFEIEAAKFIQGKTQDPQIKQYAQQMIDDHTKAQDDLKKAAQKANCDVPDEPSEAQQAMLNEMKKLDGKLLDGSYILSQVGGHDTTVLLFQLESTKGDNQDLKQFAQTTLPKLQQHLDHAKQIAMKMTGGGMTGGTGAMGAGGAMDHSGSMGGSTGGMGGNR